MCVWQSKKHTANRKRKKQQRDTKRTNVDYNTHCDRALTLSSVWNSAAWYFRRCCCYCCLLAIDEVRLCSQLYCKIENCTAMFKCALSLILPHTKWTLPDNNWHVEEKKVVFIGMKAMNEHKSIRINVQLVAKINSQYWIVSHFEMHKLWVSF